MVETRPRSSQLRTLNESSALRFWRSERRQRRFTEPTALAAGLVVTQMSRWAIAPVIDGLVALETGAIALRLTKCSDIK